MKMKAELRAFGLWDVVETERDPPLLRANPRIAQMKQQNKKCAKKYKVCLLSKLLLD